MANFYLQLEGLGRLILEDASGDILLELTLPSGGPNGADLYGFDPFTGAGRFPGADFAPGSLSAWKPTEIDVNTVLDYANQVFEGTRDRSLLTLLGNNNIGARV